MVKKIVEECQTRAYNDYTFLNTVAHLTFCSSETLFRITLFSSNIPDY